LEIKSALFLRKVFVFFIITHKNPLVINIKVLTGIETRFCRLNNLTQS